MVIYNPEIKKVEWVICQLKVVICQDGWIINDMPINKTAENWEFHPLSHTLFQCILALDLP